MSLLNDMLRDLSLEQKTSDGINNARANDLDFGAHEQRELLQQTSVVRPVRGTMLPSIAVFFVVIILLLAWKQNFWLSGASESRDMEGAVPVTNNPVQVTPADYSLLEQNQVDIVQVGGIVSSNPSATTVGPNVAPVHSVNALDERLAALEFALTRLSTAVEKSTAIEEANVAISYVAAETPASLESRVQDAPVDDKEYAAENESESIQDPFINTGEPWVQAEVTPATTEIPADAHLSISPNAVAVDQRQTEQARQLLMQGQEPEAIISLQAFIASAKTPRESTKLLLDIFNAQGNVTGMEKLLATASYLPPTDQYFYTAKISIAKQQETDAIQLLESHLTEANEQENYLALLAGLYQRAGKFQEAATLYRRLLTSAGDKAAYWLGFALAQDSLDQPQTAKQAYLRLANYSDLQPQVRTYIQQRLAALQ
ncbi:tetratricopeptide repeat protein [Cellvibrio mixtus]|uniref:tetratricopeptide repeat protein n=1 Tax=Cellvibrio mixtus TaxID=39650 RepID=UPI000587F06F|nr:hypothetical protein [Cellvibrio mixtus]